MNLKELSPSLSGADGVSAITTSEAARLLSSAGAGVLLVHYPDVDKNNLKSRYKLMSDLVAHGFTETAKLIGDSAEIILFSDVVKAKRVLHEINNDSYAIGATLFANGVAVGHN